MIEPESGNPVPPGALPEEVKDDVDAKLSDGEYVIPADVVRFLGLEKIESLVNKAKEGLSAMSQSGRVNGKKELPFPTEELQSGGKPIGMASGGVVDSEERFKYNANSGETGVIEFTGPDGKKIFIPFMNGKPINPIPEGYVKSSEKSAPGNPIKVGEDGPTIKPKQQGLSVLSQNDPSPNEGVDPSPLAGRIQDWGVKDFINFGKQKDDKGSNTIKNLARLIPGGAVAVGLRDRELAKYVPDILDNMLDTGIDQQGNKIAEEDLLSLSATRENLKNSMSEESGLGFDVGETLSGAFSKFRNFIGLDGESSPESSLKPSENQVVGYDLRDNDKPVLINKSDSSGVTGKGSGPLTYSPPPKARPDDLTVLSRGGLVKKRKK